MKTQFVLAFTNRYRSIIGFFFCKITHLEYNILPEELKQIKPIVDC